MNQRIAASLLILLAVPALVRSQVGGNVGYGQGGGKARAEQIERTKRTLTKEEMPSTATASFVDANVLMNVKADEHIVVFGIALEGETLADCSKKMEATIKSFTDELKPLKIAADDIFVDFVAQNKIYGFELQGDILNEKLVGFELKKNVSIQYKDAALIEKIAVAASRAQVYDLIKVDYIVKDIGKVQDRLMEEAARITKNKVGRYEKLLGIKLQAPAQIYAERSAVHYPTQMYDSYAAYEAEAIRAVPERQKYTVRSARKSRTFFFNALDADGFDAVINPVITEPVVQFTLYLKLKYEVEQPKAK